MKQKTKTLVSALIALTFAASSNAREKVSLADLNCNLGNIKYSKNNKWLGQVGQYKGFCKFSNHSYGARAAYIILKKRQGKTLREIVKIWAPASDGNNPAKYADFTAKFTGLNLNEKIDTDEERCQVLRAIARMEGGHVTDGEIREGIRIASAKYLCAS